MDRATSQKAAVELKTKAELSAMRRAGEVAGLTLEEVGKNIRPGVTTKELDRIASRFVKRQGGIPKFLGYRGYPASLCVSINDEVVHGIPSERVINAGDLVSVDFAAEVDGFVGDLAKTWMVEPVSDEARNLVKVTEASLGVGIDAMTVGNRVGDIGSSIQNFVEKNGFSVVRDYVGHGIGRQMHEEPAVPNFGDARTGLRLEPGLVLALEPMVNMGDWHVRVLGNGWTVVTQDGSLSAHFEHTVAVAEDGPIVLTKICA